jgi:predicted alpha-1,2-mannosidase
VQVSPETRLEGWQGCAGYHMSDRVIYGFTHTHLSGTGCSDYGDVLLMPFTGAGSVINTEYSSKFSHKNEFAAPGYYSVMLDKNNIKVELTTSKRVGMHRYTFPKNNESKGIVLDLKHRDVVLHSEIRHEKNLNVLIGVRNSHGWNENQKLEYSIVFSQPIERIEYYSDDIKVDAAAGTSGPNSKALIYFASNVTEIITKVAISSLGFEDNRVHRNHVEIQDFDFDRVQKEAELSWNKELGKIVVETSNSELKKVFYTALYHCFTSPYLFTDIEGYYQGMDGEVHQAPKEHDVYTVFSLWDTYRALHPLLNLIDRKRSGDFIYTFMKHYEQGGMLPMWELAAFETWCMIGYHAVSVIYDAFVKGIAPYDKEKMLEAMVHSAKLNKLGRPEYAQYGFIPGEKEHEGVSKTLEYAYDDWCIAQFAKTIGNEEVYQEFIKRCQYYKNMIDPDGFMRPKYNGAWIVPFDPTEVNNHFTEGNSWQYSTYIPHDFANYIALRGGDEVVEQFLDSLFNTSAELIGRHQVDVTGLIGQYAHGNEPSHHAAYLYT